MLIGDVIPLWKIDEAWGRGHNVSVNVCMCVCVSVCVCVCVVEEEEEEAWCTKLENFQLSPAEFDII